MSEKIKVVWICHLSNPMIRKELKFDKLTPMAIARRIWKKTICHDFAKWNTNAIFEFEKYRDVELHIISPHSGISSIQEFDINNVYYHFFPSEIDGVIEFLRGRLNLKINEGYSKTTKIITNLIYSLEPDIIHMIGAENPYYGESALYLPSNIPLIVSLQTLMNDAEFIKNYPISRNTYEYRSNLESKILQRADYIGTKHDYLKNIIISRIDSQAKFLDLQLAVGESVELKESVKEYDFVYFAANISKAADSALEAFALAQMKYPNLSLHIVGGYDELFYRSMISRIDELHVSNVDFTGMLPTHEDVLNEIRKARYAILPLKIDLISGTIREAMANGLPVVSTVTPATPKLNKKRQSILLAEKDDFIGMAEAMCHLVEDLNFAEIIRTNAVETLNEEYNNAEAMKAWVKAYKKVLNS